MPIIVWNHDFEVKINKIDEQHKKLVALINELFDAMLAGQGRDIMGKILKDLVDYTKYHFATEESLMSLHAYPGLAEHQKKHTNLTNTVVDFLRKFQTGDEQITKELFTFLKEWLTQHILRTDKDYIPHFQSKGVS